MFFLKFKRKSSANATVVNEKNDTTVNKDKKSVDNKSISKNSSNCTWSREDLLFPPPPSSPKPIKQRANLDSSLPLNGVPMTAAPTTKPPPVLKAKSKDYMMTVTTKAINESMKQWSSQIEPREYEDISFFVSTLRTKFKQEDKPAIEFTKGWMDFVESDLFETKAAMNKLHPHFKRTLFLDGLREKDFSRLDKMKQVYFDFTGGALYGQSQFQAYNQCMAFVFGNPHSHNPTSSASTALNEHVREYVLEFFKASPANYACVFTQNASNAIKIVGESFDFGPKSTLLLCADNHNSCLGIREYAHARGAKVLYVPVDEKEMRMDPTTVTKLLTENAPEKGVSNLFVFPGQSNSSGVQHPLEYIQKAQSLGWKVLLDAAAFVPTNVLEVDKHHPDFVSLSFYKIFGFPTGVGALIGKKSELCKLKVRYFGGGTISAVSLFPEDVFMKGSDLDIHESFEYGTINYLSIPAVEIGLRYMESIGMDLVHERVLYLTSFLLNSLSEIQHSNGMPLVKVHGPKIPEMRGGTIAMTMYDPEGNNIPYDIVERLATACNISIRTGCFCNPGALSTALGLNINDFSDALHKFANEKHYPDPFETKNMLDITLPNPRGAVRASIGFITNIRDIHCLLLFLQNLCDTPLSTFLDIPY